MVSLKEPSGRIYHIAREVWERIAEADRLDLGAQQFVWCTRSADRSARPATAATQELVEVAVVPDDPESHPLVHLVCGNCQAEVWWPAELTGERRCFHCGGELRVCEAPPESSGHVPDGPESVERPHVVGLLRRLAEHHRRSVHAQRRDRAVGGVSLSDDPLRDHQAQAAQRLELLASSLDRLHVDDLDALRLVIELMPDVAQTANPADAEQLRVIVERAHRAVESIADLMMTRDARL